MNIKTEKKEQLIDITDKVQEEISLAGVQEGLVALQSMHTTAGLTINENADPDVKEDILKGLSVFDRDDYQHGEGNSPAHIKASMMGSSLKVIVREGKLQLGRWQGIMFCEFDGPRDRQIMVEIINNLK